MAADRLFSRSDDADIRRLLGSLHHLRTARGLASTDCSTDRRNLASCDTDFHAAAEFDGSDCDGSANRDAHGKSDALANNHGRRAADSHAHAVMPCQSMSSVSSRTTLGIAASKPARPSMS
jgi:hypothetical protein